MINDRETLQEAADIESVFKGTRKPRKKTHNQQ